MDTRQRPTEPRTNTATTAEGDSSGSALGALREQTFARLEGADQAISRVLEENSGQYLMNHRQRGGE